MQGPKDTAEGRSEDGRNRDSRGPGDRTNTKTQPAAAPQGVVWQKARLLPEEPERVGAVYGTYVERRNCRLGGDPDREARGLPARLEKLERRRSKPIDPGADSTTGREDLRAKLAEVDEEPGRLGKEREELTGRFSAKRGTGLRRHLPRDRGAVYDALRMTTDADEKGGVPITGIFGADITELLPASGAVAKAGARRYDVRLDRRLPTPHGALWVWGVPTWGHHPPGTPGAVGIRPGDVAGCRIGGFEPLLNPVRR